MLLGGSVQGMSALGEILGQLLPSRHETLTMLILAISYWVVAPIERPKRGELSENAISEQVSIFNKFMIFSARMFV